MFWVSVSCSVLVLYSQASVPILKFLFNFCVDRECAAAEAFDGGQDIVGCLGPAEGFGVGVAGLDIGIDRRFQVGGRAMGATLDLNRATTCAAERVFPARRAPR